MFMFLFYVYFKLTVAPGGNLETICSKDFLGLSTINMYYYFYYYYYYKYIAILKNAQYIWFKSHYKFLVSSFE